MKNMGTKNVIRGCWNICLSVISVSLVTPNYATIFRYIYRIRLRVLTECLVRRMRGIHIVRPSLCVCVCEELIR